MGRRLVIVADDLTGAADAAAAYGPWAEVAVSLRPDRAPLPDAEVVAVDTDSRHGSPDAARAAVTAAVLAALAAGAAIYKKVDSTLRGNIAAEVGAALNALGGQHAAALFAPAFPATGRTVHSGVLHVDGQPRGELAELFAGSGLRAATLDLVTVRRGVGEVVASCRRLRAGGVQVICCDAETDDDLETLHSAATTLGPSVLQVGSAGLTRIAARRGRPPVGFRPSRPGPERAGRPVLTVLGSYSPLAQTQRTALATAGVPTIAVAEPFGEAQQRAAATSLRATLTAQADALLVPDPDSPVHRSRAPEVAAALSAVARDIVRDLHPRLGGLVLTGGETARAVLLAVGAIELRVHGELEPGVVLSDLPALDGLPLVTKAGAFGDAGTLQRIRTGLHSPAAGYTQVS